MTLTQQNFHRTFAHEIVNVEFGGSHLSEFVYGVTTVDIKKRYERLKYVQMERRCDQFSVGPPFVACTKMYKISRVS